MKAVSEAIQNLLLAMAECASCGDLKTLTIRVRGQVGRYFGPNWVPLTADQWIEKAKA